MNFLLWRPSASTFRSLISLPVRCGCTCVQCTHTCRTPCWLISPYPRPLRLCAVLYLSIFKCWCVCVSVCLCEFITGEWVPGFWLWRQWLSAQSYEGNGQIEIPTFKRISGSSWKNGTKRDTYFSADIFEIHAYRLSLQKVNGKCRLWKAMHRLIYFPLPRTFWATFVLGLVF